MIVPKDILHIILDYDGRIKYKNGKYVNIIHIHDERYSMLKNIIQKKLRILEKAEIYNTNGHQFYFEFGFDINANVGLCYDYNFSFSDKFEICYYDMRYGWEQIRTYF